MQSVWFCSYCHISLYSINTHHYFHVLFRLRELVSDGKTAEKIICNYNDWFVCQMHKNPPMDASLQDRDGSTSFDRTNIHPSSVDLRDSELLLSNATSNNDTALLQSCLCRHRHQKYCDKNSSKRNKAHAAALRDGRSNVNILPEDIPHKCRFNFPNATRDKTFVKVTRFIVNKSKPDEKVGFIAFDLALFLNLFVSYFTVIYNPLDAILCRHCS